MVIFLVSMNVYFSNACDQLNILFVFSKYTLLLCKKDLNQNFPEKHAFGSPLWLLLMFLFLEPLPLPLRWFF